MLIANLKRKENIAEYLLYMWQVEDIIRANNLDINKIEQTIIDKFNVDENQKTEIKDWYEGLIKMMELENKKESGHLQINKNVIIRLADLHNQLLKSEKHQAYSAMFYKVLPSIVALRAKTHDDSIGELETCFNALYGTILLRLQGKEISESTLTAIKEISQFIALLSAYFKSDEEKPIFEQD